MIIFTSDIDWAPDEIIEYMLDIFVSYQTKCTLFVTHPSDVLKKCNRDLFEIAIHPNFNPLLNGNISDKSADSILDELMNWYPEARGVRSHSMTQNTPLLGKFLEKGLLYEANHFLPYQKIQPFKLWNGLWRIPYNWEDDIHFAYQNSFTEVGMTLNDDDLFVFDFHPIHVFLNTENEQRYQNAKEHYHNPTELKKIANQDTPGTEDMLIYLLKTIQNKQFKNNNLIGLFNNNNLTGLDNISTTKLL